MEFNVSQLLKAPSGEQRTYEIAEEITELGDGTKARALSGIVVLTRVSPGVMVEVHASALLDLTCVRCLEPFTYRAEFDIDEVYRPSVDVLTGLPLEIDPEVEAYLWIDHNHILSVRESIRQSIIVSIPIAPVCSEACLGLCPRCGSNLNEGPCQCAEEEADPRWEPLKALLNQLS